MKENLPLPLPVIYTWGFIPSVHGYFLSLVEQWRRFILQQRCVTLDDVRLMVTGMTRYTCGVNVRINHVFVIDGCMWINKRPTMMSLAYWGKKLPNIISWLTDLALSTFFSSWAGRRNSLQDIYIYRKRDGREGFSFISIYFKRWSNLFSQLCKCRAHTSAGTCLLLFFIFVVRPCRK